MYAEYDQLFTRAEEIGEQIKQSKEQFEALHNQRKSMKDHGIDMWSKLDQIKDAEHLEMKEHYFLKLQLLTRQAGLCNAREMQIVQQFHF